MAKGAPRRTGGPGKLANILIDIDDTLFPSTEFSALARRNAINAMISMGIGADFKSLQSLLENVIARKGSNYENHFGDVCSRLGIRRPGRFVAAAVAAYHDTKTAIQPFPGAPLALLRLKEAGFSIYVATNGSSIKQWDKLIRLRLALYFEDVFVSEELGGEKGEAFYRKVLRAIGARPGSCVMVGDREDADILPARAVGMKTVRMLSGKYSKNPTKADMAIRDISELPEAIAAL